ncbi:MAG TPA: cyclic nucleotide-binding domain-containing protein [Acidimicrobiia bacterium]|nr:cyclic nucleotide-binding domain-containing protein [Acidimicrobiia bacterium]
MRNTDKIQHLGKVPLFAGLNRRQLGEVARHTDEIEVAAATDLTSEGHVGRQFGIVLSGSAVVKRNNRKLADLGKGDFFGEMALLLQQPSSATVTTMEDSTLLVMHGREFTSLLDSVPAIARKLAEGLAARLVEADRKLVL